MYDSACFQNPKKGYSAAAIFGETNFGRKAAKFGRAQNQCPKIRHGVELRGELRI
jgi:hypothetical protein